MSCLLVPGSVCPLLGPPAGALLPKSQDRGLPLATGLLHVPCPPISHKRYLPSSFPSLESASSWFEMVQQSSKSLPGQTCPWVTGPPETLAPSFQGSGPSQASQRPVWMRIGGRKGKGDQEEGGAGGTAFLPKTNIIKLIYMQLQGKAI